MMRRDIGKLALWLTLAALLVFLLAGVPTLGQDSDADELAAGWTPELTMKFRLIGDVTLTADGSLAAYTIRTAEMEGERSEFVQQIWVASTDSRSNFQYTHGEKSATAPAFSPDDRYLAFLSARGEGGKAGDKDDQAKTQIWRMRVAGGEAVALTEAEASISSFQWSPDGTRIAFVMPNPETEDEKTEKKEKRDVILVNQDFKYQHLYVLSLDENKDGEPLRLTEGNFHVTSFDWSPDGESLVFTHQPDPRINSAGVDRDLSVVPSSGGDAMPLVARPGVDHEPHYSPDGAWVAFASHGGSPERVGLSDIFVVASAGGTPQALAQTPDRDASLLGWSANGLNVFVSEAIGTTRQVLSVPLSGASPRSLTPIQGVVSSPSFSHSSASMAFVYETLDKPQEVYISPRSSLEMTRLSAINDSVPIPPSGPTELVSWSSPDGLEIEGLLTYPVDYEPGRSYPTILCIHGGPAGVFSQSFTGAPGLYQYQVLAQEGYAILRPNPRGSTGYGKEFRYANVRDWGFGDYEDLMAGVDKVIEMGVADPDRLFVMGWSYGGYMTSFVVTRTGRFRAASMGAGLPNLVSMVTTTDIPDYLVAHMGGEVWDDYAAYEKHSAMYRIKNVTTPTQVIHGAQDLRVPFTQGQEFFVALDRRGVPTEMVVYPRTPHGPREPKLLMDVTPRILTWFARFRDRSEAVAVPEATAAGSLE